MNPRRCAGAAVAFAASTVAFVPVAYVSMFSGFHPYDDEGYFLILLRQYLAGRALFTQIFTFYGPFFFESIAGVFKLLELEAVHDSGRILSIAIWLTASLVGGLAVRWLTGNLWLAVGAQFVTFHVLAALTDEPMNPSGPIALLLTILVAAAATRSTRPRAGALAIGGVVGALCLVKINVGVFAAVAVASATAGGLSPRYRRIALPAMLALCLLLPLLLVSGLLNLGWVIEYSATVVLAGAAVGVAYVAAAPGPLPPHSVMWLTGGGMLVAIASIGIAMIGGTNLSDLVDSLVVTAARMPQVFVYPLKIGSIDVLAAALSFAAAVVILNSRTTIHVPPLVAGLSRTVVGFAILMTLLRLPTTIFFVVLPLAWVATQSPFEGADDPTGPYARLLLPALAVLESLQAYPVAGTQVSLSGLSLVPVGAIILNDGISQLRRAGREASPPRRFQGVWVAPMTTLLSIAAYGLFGYYATAAYAAEAPLGLPGAGLIRVPPQQGVALRTTVAAISRECSEFITYPGMVSFYVWTGQQQPSPRLYGLWMFTLDGAQQQAVVQELAGKQRLCVVKDQAVIDFWSEGRSVPQLPLVSFIDANFVPDGGSYGEYQLLVPR
ncbi:MAG TPA: hypothetical protein VMW11_00915 [Candidatus Dormibacteraeota bacterium]|nr:hypothetical protein [Candidatus Dormibacteraeota bacterium]